MLQNFHTEEEMVNVSGTGVPTRGIDFLDAEFAYVVESGSTVIKTEAEDRQQALELFQLGAIDQVGLLETIKFRGWREIVERMAQDGPLEQAMQILVQAGLPVELVEQLYQFAMQSQGGPGDDPVSRSSQASAVQSGGVSMAQNNRPPHPRRGSAPWCRWPGAGSGSGRGCWRQR
jgi:hypothetical protein